MRAGRPDTLGEVEIVVSRRFYEFCKAHNLKCGFKPVRIDEGRGSGGGGAVPPAGASPGPPARPSPTPILEP